MISKREIDCLGCENCLELCPFTDEEVPKVLSKEGCFRRIEIIEKLKSTIPPKKEMVRCQEIK